MAAPLAVFGLGVGLDSEAGVEVRPIRYDPAAICNVLNRVSCSLHDYSDAEPSQVIDSSRLKVTMRLAREMRLL
ncbi:hypothetical protein D9M71_286170 [compost metagenome]